MDAKERAGFINAVGNSSVKKCLECGEENIAEAMFCASCGKPLTVDKKEKADTDPKPLELKKEAPNSEQLEPKKEASHPEQLNPKKEASDSEPVKPVKMAPDPEPVSAFAQGLPEWDMVPPQVFVRRKGMR